MAASDSSDLNGTKERGSKRLKLQEKEDRISDLSDSIIHHILSFLPSTKQAIQTGILSKRWRNQWSSVPDLLFDFQCNEKDYARFIDSTLLQYDCSKMKRFHMCYDFERDTNFTSKICFATRRNVEELFLCFYRPNSDSKEAYMLPKSVFDNVSLVNLQYLFCEFQLSSQVNLPSLKILKIGCYHLKDSKSIEFFLSGSLSLEFLEIRLVTSTNPVIIASKSLKALIFKDVTITHDLEISCPCLEGLRVKATKSDCPSIFPNKTVLDVLSGSPLLNFLDLRFCDLEDLVIASKSLITLAIGWMSDSALEISCPNLKNLVCVGPVLEKCKLRNLPSSCCAVLAFDFQKQSKKILARKILVELEPVQDLQVNFDWFVEILSALKIEKLSNPLLNVKCLTLHYPNFDHALGIVNALRCSPALERLVIKLEVHECQGTADLDFKIFKESYWISKGSVFTCLVSQLKTVEVIGLTKKDGKYDVVLCFIKFLLETARVLEKMTVILQDGGTDFQVEVSRKLLSFPTCSPHAVVELL